MQQRAPLTAAAIAKQRFEKYLAEKLYGSFDLSVWEFYTFLLEQAKKHHIDTSGYGSFAYQEDEIQARENCKLAMPDCFVTPTQVKKSKLPEGD